METKEQMLTPEDKLDTLSSFMIRERNRWGMSGATMDVKMGVGAKHVTTCEYKGKGISPIYVRQSPTILNMNRRKVTIFHYHCLVKLLQADRYKTILPLIAEMKRHTSPGKKNDFPDVIEYIVTEGPFIGAHRKPIYKTIGEWRRKEQQIYAGFREYVSHECTYTQIGHIESNKKYPNAEYFAGASKLYCHNLSDVKELALVTLAQMVSKPSSNNLVTVCREMGIDIYSTLATYLSIPN